MTAILLDTHVFIWHINGDETLSKPLRKTIDTAIQNNELHLSAISLWEISMLGAKKRIIFSMPCLEWLNKAIEFSHTHIMHLTPAIAVESSHLPGAFHEDPADRIIVATARINGLLLLTRDKKILQYSKNKYVSAMKA